MDKIFCRTVGGYGAAVLWFFQNFNVIGGIKILSTPYK